MRRAVVANVPERHMNSGSNSGGATKSRSMVRVVIGNYFGRVNYFSDRVSYRSVRVNCRSAYGNGLSAYVHAGGFAFGHDNVKVAYVSPYFCTIRFGSFC